MPDDRIADPARVAFRPRNSPACAGYGDCRFRDVRRLGADGLQDAWFFGTVPDGLSQGGRRGGCTSRMAGVGYGRGQSGQMQGDARLRPGDPREAEGGGLLRGVGDAGGALHPHARGFSPSAGYRGCLRLTMYRKRPQRAQEQPSRPPASTRYPSLLTATFPHSGQYVSSASSERVFPT